MNDWLEDDPNEEQSNGIEAELQAELQAERQMTDDDILDIRVESTTATEEKDPLSLSIQYEEREEPLCQVGLHSLGYFITFRTKTPEEAQTLFNALQSVTEIEAD